MGLDMMTRTFSRLTWSCLLALGLGCGDDDDTTPGTDGGPVMDAAMVDSGPMTPELPLLQRGPIGAEPDAAAAYSCHGERMSPPTDGEAINFNLRVEEFRTDQTFPELCVKFYADNMPVVGDECDASDLSTDSEGRVTVNAPAGGWYAYRVYPKSGPTASRTIDGSVQVNETAPTTAGETLRARSISAATLDLIPTVLGISRVPGTAIVAGTVFDCDDEPVYGAITRVYRDDGTFVAEGARNDDPHYRFFDGDSFPRAEQVYTHVDGLFGLINLDVASGGEFVWVEAWGRRGDGEPEIIACERIPVFKGTISIINLRPLRSDAPSCPGLR